MLMPKSVLLRLCVCVCAFALITRCAASSSHLAAVPHGAAEAGVRWDESRAFRAGFCPVFLSITPQVPRQCSLASKIPETLGFEACRAQREHQEGFKVQRARGAQGRMGKEEGAQSGVKRNKAKFEMFGA